MDGLHKFVKSVWFIHLLAFLGLFALWGFLATDSKPLIFFMALSFCGASCAAFVRVIDAASGRINRT
jgi:Ca2+/H+ antiporter